jgi:hypothetical protein
VTGVERAVVTVESLRKAQAGDRDAHLEDQADARRLEEHVEQTEPGWA